MLKMASQSKQWHRGKQREAKQAALVALLSPLLHIAMIHDVLCQTSLPSLLMPMYADTSSSPTVASMPAQEPPNMPQDADVPNKGGTWNTSPTEAERMDMDKVMTNPGVLEPEEGDTPNIDLPPLEVMAASYIQ